MEITVIKFPLYVLQEFPGTNHEQYQVRGHHQHGEEPSLDSRKLIKKTRTRTMPHNEPPDIVRFNNAGRAVRVDSGQQYPRCSAQQLNGQSRAVELSGQVFGNHAFLAISLDQAAADLIAFLEVPPNTRQQLIIDDLLDAFGYTHWQPDIVIKAFGDLDEIYFNGALRRRVQIEWCCDPSRFVSRSSHFPYAYGMTFLEHTVVPTATIVLNAQVLFKESFYESRRRRVWGTMLHEMIHGELQNLPSRRGQGADSGRQYTCVYVAILPPMSVKKLRERIHHTALSSRI